MSEVHELSALQQRFEEVQAALARAEREPGEQERKRLREEIVSLFRETEALIERVVGVREEIRPLVERYRALFPAEARAAESPESSSGASPRVDHLGSSTFLERGWNAIASGDYATALKELDRALSLAPGDARAEALRAWALMRLGHLEEARVALEALLAREANHALARTNLGYVCLREGRFADAIEHLSRTVRSGTDRTAALYANLYMGMVYAEREMFRDAEGFLRRAIEMGPNLVEAYWELGRTHYRAGNRSHALEAWKRGAKINQYSQWGERCERAAAQLEGGQPISVD